jgi:hypothetical protein
MVHNYSALQAQVGLAKHDPQMKDGIGPQSKTRGDGVPLGHLLAASPE